jgi:hypothetical protein
VWKSLRIHDGFLKPLDSRFQNYQKGNPGCFASYDDCSDIIVVSDYGGEHQQAGFHAYGFLIFDWQSSNKWWVQSSAVRGRFLAARDEEMAYKKLSNGNPERSAAKSSALRPLLEAANELNGIALTFLVSRRVESVLEKGGIQHLQTICDNLCVWRPATVEKLYRIEVFLAFLLAGLCLPEQRIYWLTDDDEIVANPDRIPTARKMLNVLSNFHVKRPLMLRSAHD